MSTADNQFEWDYFTCRFIKCTITFRLNNHNFCLINVVYEFWSLIASLDRGGANGVPDQSSGTHGDHPNALTSSRHLSSLLPDIYSQAPPTFSKYLIKIYYV